jgi:leader peptidase (prepilin peptidase)/N-methyltransferase
MMAIYVGGFAWLQSRQTTLFGPGDLIVPRLIDVVILIWLFWVGSSIGSFLNVVAWRMPRGESVNGRSYCPRCRTQLQARDNFPVFGWLALRGRCRCCRLPISARYPIVELSVGVSLTLIGIAELYRLSLPHQTVHWHGGPLWAPVVDYPMLLTLFYHSVAVAFGWAFGLIRMDGHRLPARLTATAVAALVIPMIAYPHLMVVSWRVDDPGIWRPEDRYLDAVLRVTTALAATVVFARYLARGICPGADPKLDPLSQRTAKLIDLIAIMMVPAIVAGWQAVPAVIVLASLIAWVLRPVLPVSADALGRLAIAMPIALTFQITFWRRLFDSRWWPPADNSPWVTLAAAGLVCFVPLWLNDRDRRPTEGQDVPADDADDDLEE